VAQHVCARLGDDVSIAELRRLPGGASRETWLLAVVHPGGREERLVLRRDPPGHVVESSRAGEYALLEAAHEAGVPVPRMRWVEDDATVLGAPFFVMEWVAGETIGRKLLRDERFATAREVLPGQLATALAAVHGIDPSRPAHSFLARPDEAGSPALTEVARYRDVLRGIAPDPHPTLELAVRWLERRAPSPGTTAIVHGDFRIGNVIVGEDGLRAVIDWELSHVGDPLEDLGWLCVRSWRFGNDDRPAGGLCDRERFVSAYEAARGTAVDRDAVHWWEVFGNFKWAVVCIMQAQTFLGGAGNVELAALGRRTAEMELELLELMEAT
jgi:aminoglycoside phosphotransferase (APT) family kinase protein